MGHRLCCQVPSCVSIFLALSLPAIHVLKTSVTPLFVYRQNKPCQLGILVCYIYFILEKAYITLSWVQFFYFGYFLGRFTVHLLCFFPHIQEQYVAMEGVIILHFGVKMFIYLFFCTSLLICRHLCQGLWAVGLWCTLVFLILAHAQKAIRRERLNESFFVYGCRELMLVAIKMSWKRPRKHRSTVFTVQTRDENNIINCLLGITLIADKIFFDMVKLAHRFAGRL